jgi:hypothetical protein
MSAGQKPRLGELLLGTKGLALLRLAFNGDDATRSARVSEGERCWHGWTSLSWPLP